MNGLTDETLIALADGALSPEDRLVAERLLADDEQARRRLLSLRLSALAIRETYCGLCTDQVPERMHLILFGHPVRREPRQRLLGWLIPDCRATTFERQARTWLPLAICITAGFAGFAAILATSRTAIDAKTPGIALGRIDRNSDLAKKLDQSSGSVFVPASAASARFTIVATVRNRNGELCNEVDVRTDERSSHPGKIILACRTTNGGWHVVGAAVVPPEGQPAAVAAPQEFRSAMSGVMALIGAVDTEWSVEKGTKSQ